MVLLICVSAGMQLFALYNHTEELNTSLRFYSLRVPLQVRKEAGLITGVDANWLDHMTQHFTSGARLIDGFFHLTEDNGLLCGYSSVVSLILILFLEKCFLCSNARGKVRASKISNR